MSNLSEPQPIGPTTLLGAVFMRRNRSFTPMVLTYGGETQPHVVGETPAGSIDGINTTYTTVGNFRNDTLAVYANGLRMKASLDFIVTGGDTFQMIEALETGDLLTVDYLKP